MVAHNLAKRLDLPMAMYPSTAAFGGCSSWAHALEEITLALLCARRQRALLNGTGLAYVQFAVMHQCLQAP